MAGWTLAQLEAIEAAIATGATKVKYEDREVTYNSTSELLKLRRIMRDALGLNDGLVRDVHVITDKGLP